MEIIKSNGNEICFKTIEATNVGAVSLGSCWKSLGKILHNVLGNLKEYVFDVKIHNFSFKDQKIVFYLSKNILTPAKNI